MTTAKKTDSFEGEVGAGATNAQSVPPSPQGVGEGGTESPRDIVALVRAWQDAEKELRRACSDFSTDDEEDNAAGMEGDARRAVLAFDLDASSSATTPVSSTAGAPASDEGAPRQMSSDALEFTDSDLLDWIITNHASFGTSGSGEITTAGMVWREKRFVRRECTFGYEWHCYDGDTPRLATIAAINAPNCAPDDTTGCVNAHSNYHNVHESPVAALHAEVQRLRASLDHQTELTAATQHMLEVASDQCGVLYASLDTVGRELEQMRAFAKNLASREDWFNEFGTSGTSAPPTPAEENAR